GVSIVFSCPKWEVGSRTGRELDMIHNLYTSPSVKCSAQTQSVQRKSSTATVKRSDPKGKVQGPKLDDGSGGFPPFRFGKGGGGGGGGGGGSSYFGGFLLFTIVLLLDYLKEFEKYLLARKHRAGDDDDAGYDTSGGMLGQSP
uniref:Uncharacterized protein n=1 Tax=Aegilops tauschii subsp. strangulata TaxID=200361 RepID=A0A453JIB0_AEGTS